MKLINYLLIVFTAISITAQASINDKKYFDSSYPAKYDNTATQLVKAANKIAHTKKLISETPFIEVAKENDNHGSSRHHSKTSTGLKPDFPTVSQDMRDAGYEHKASFTYQKWYSLSERPSWSLDDKENHTKLIDKLPTDEEWADAYLLPKGREISISFILMDSPDIESLGKFRIDFEPNPNAYSRSLGKMVVAAYKREQAKVAKAIGQVVLSGYAFITVKENGVEKQGWIKLSSLVPNSKSKKKKKR